MKQRPVGYVTHGCDTNCAKKLGDKTKGKRPLERSKHKWKDNIVTNLKRM
jgi:hypothetical protein